MNEAVTSLATCNPLPTLKDLATIGWETVARILWIREHFPLNALRGSFNRDAIKCMHCSSSSSLINLPSGYGCLHIASGDAAELTFPGSASAVPGSVDFWVPLRQIRCMICRVTPFSLIVVSCNSCSYTYHPNNNPTVRVTVYMMKAMIEEMFGEEIKDHEFDPSLLES